MEKHNRKRGIPQRKNYKKAALPLMFQQKAKGLKKHMLSHYSQAKPQAPFEKLCLYCQQSHNLAACSEIKVQPHKERGDFLKSKGLCFGCLEYGHVSRFCKRRMECKECALKHPDILHIIKEGSAEESALPKKKEDAHGSRKLNQRKVTSVLNHTPS